MVSREEVITLIDDAFKKYNDPLSNYVNKTYHIEKNDDTGAEKLLAILKNKKNEFNKNQYQSDINYVKNGFKLQNIDSLVKLSNGSLQNLKNMLSMLDLGGRYEIAINYAYDAVKSGISDPDIIKAIRTKLRFRGKM